MEYFLFGFVWGEPESERPVPEDQSEHLTRSLAHNYPEAQLSSCVSQLSAEWTVDVSAVPGQGTHSRARPEAAQGRVLVIGGREI